MPYAIILSGGKGRRLWPVSRQNMPKQFIDFFGTGRTLLQHTFDRMVKIMPAENIFVVTGAQFESVAREQLPELPAGNLLLESINRNTAPATLLALRKIKDKQTKQTEGAPKSGTSIENQAEVATVSGVFPSEYQSHSVIITPADQLIINEEAFHQAVQKGAAFVEEHPTVLTMGVPPSRPEPGYGYIQIGEGNDDVFHIKSFTEKPDREFARMFIESGEFLWNSGIYMSSISHMEEQLEDLLHTDEDLDFSRLLNLSLDMAILEKMKNKVVMQCHFGWADIGAWHGIYEALSNDDRDNVLVNSRSRLVDDNSSRNVIALPEGKLAVISDLDGYIVAEKDNVLLICKKQDSSAKVRKLLSRIENEEDLREFL